MDARWEISPDVKLNHDLGLFIIYFDELWIAEDYHDSLPWYKRGLTVVCEQYYAVYESIPRSRVVIILVDDVYNDDYVFGRGKSWICIFILNRLTPMWRDGIGWFIVCARFW